MNDDNIMYIKKIPFLFLALLLSFILPSSLISQEVKVVRDFNLWTGIELEKAITKNFTATLEQEIRFKNNASMINNYFTQAGIEYQINKNFSLGGKYRFIRNLKQNKSFENRSRYCFDLRYKGKIRNISFRYRMRYQKEVESLDLLDQAIPYEKYFRNKVEIRYTRLMDLTPYISAEIFELFQLQEYPEFNQARIMAGVKYTPGRIGSFDLEWGFDRELNSYLPYTFYITKINYSYSF